MVTKQSDSSLWKKLEEEFHIGDLDIKYLSLDEELSLTKMVNGRLDYYSTGSPLKQRRNCTLFLRQKLNIDDIFAYGKDTT